MNGTETNNFSLKKYLKEKKDFFEREFYKLLPTENSIGKNVFDAMQYSAKAPGKRIRPILVFAAAELVGGNVNDVLPFACAIECIHTYSLIHDDLPAMDDDDLRRGAPTCHKAYDEATAILAGDGLLTLAFEIVSDKKNFGNLSYDKILESINIMATASGAFGMVGGQMGDIFMEGREDITPENVFWIHSRKTGKIINASLEIGARLSSANEIEIEHIKKFGENLGLAFQVKDDLLDIEGDSKITGKPVGSDKKKKKLTFLHVYGVEKSRQMLYDFRDNAIKSLEFLGEKAIPLISLARYVAERDK
jgi:geranylgeranyl diphosphate synthase type II